MKPYISPDITILELDTESLIAVSFGGGETTVMEAPSVRRQSSWDEYEAGGNLN